MSELLEAAAPNPSGPNPSGQDVIRRVLHRRDLILFGLVIVGPTAVYPVYGIIQTAAHGQAALSYLVAMVAMLFTATSYGRMSSVYPSAGSTYTYVQQTFNPYIGFLAGWAMILDYFLLPLIGIILPALTAARLVPSIPYSLWVIFFTVGITIINVLGIRTLAKANTVMMIAMTFVMILFIGLAIRYVAIHHGVASLASITGIYIPGNFSAAPIMLGASIAALSYIGFDAISTLAEDSVNPGKDIGFATVVVCLIQTAICIATVYFAALAWNNYHSFTHIETAILDIGSRIGGEVMFLILTAVLVVSGVSCALTGQAGASRLMFAMGRDGVIPHSLFGRLHPRFGTPTRAIYISSVALLITALLSSYQLAVETLNFGAFIGFILVNLSVIQHFFVTRKQRSGRALLNNLLVPLAGAVVCGYVWINLDMQAKTAGFIWLGIGILYLAFQTRGFKSAPSKWSSVQPKCCE